MLRIAENRIPRLDCFILKNDCERYGEMKVRDNVEVASYETVLLERRQFDKNNSDVKYDAEILESFIVEF